MLETRNHHHPDQAFTHTLHYMDTSPVQLGKKITERVLLLKEQSHFLDAEIESVRFLNQLLPTLEAHGMSFSHEEIADMRLATLVSDIGKTGSVQWNKTQCEFFLKMFSVSNLPTGDITVAEFFSSPAAQQVLHISPDECLRLFGTLGITEQPDQFTMRQFWDLHLKYTAEIISAEHNGISAEAKRMALNHHWLEDNPHHASSSSPVLTDLLVILMDKYQAYMRRGNQTLDHHTAMKLLRTEVQRKLAGKSDPGFMPLLNHMQEALSEEKTEILN